MKLWPKSLIALVLLGVFPSSGAFASLATYGPSTNRVLRPIHPLRTTPAAGTEAGIIAAQVPQVCLACRKPPHPLRAITTHVRPESQRLNIPAPRSHKSVLLAMRRGSKPIGAGCAQRIMDEFGNPNEIGKKLIARMSLPQYKSLYTGARGLAGVCPKFAIMDAGQRLKAWTWFWLVLGNREDGTSGCDPLTPHHTPPRPGIGIWGLNLYPRDRDWRGPDCQGDIRKVDKQVSCAVATMADLQLSQHESAFHDGSYWATLNSHGGRRSRHRQPPVLIADMKRYAPCFAK